MSPPFARLSHNREQESKNRRYKTNENSRDLTSRQQINSQSRNCVMLPILHIPYAFLISRSIYLCYSAESPAFVISYSPPFLFRYMDCALLNPRMPTTRNLRTKCIDRK